MVRLHRDNNQILSFHTANNAVLIEFHSKSFRGDPKKIEEKIRLFLRITFPAPKMVLSVNTVFENFELMSIIMNNFSYPELSAIREVNSDFNRVGKELYRQKHREARSESQRVYFKYLGRNCGLNMYQQAVSFSSFVDEFMEKNLWPFLVHNPEFAQNIFFRASEFHPYRRVVHKYDMIHDKIRPYLYIADLSDITVLSMKKLLTYKGVKGAYKMNKSQLRSRLKYERDKSFVWKLV